MLRRDGEGVKEILARERKGARNAGRCWIPTLNAMGAFRMGHPALTVGADLEARGESATHPVDSIVPVMVSRSHPPEHSECERGCCQGYQHHAHQTVILSGRFQGVQRY